MNLTPQVMAEFDVQALDTTIRNLCNAPPKVLQDRFIKQELAKSCDYLVELLIKLED